MIPDLEVIRKICISRNMKELSISSFPTFANQSHNEGIEVKGGKVLSFWANVGGEARNYTEPPGEAIKVTLQMIADARDIGEDQTVVPEPTHNAKEMNPEMINNLPAIFQGDKIITFADMDDFQKKYPSTISRMLLFQHTPKKLIKSKNGRGGKQSYLEGYVMKMEAWIAFLGQVSSTIEGFIEDSQGVTCFGSITVPVDGQLITVSGVGIDLQEFTKEGQKPVFSLHELRKNACTDMKKKILADMGFNRDVYSGEV